MLCCCQLYFMAVVKVCWVMLITQNLYKELKNGIKKNSLKVWYFLI